MLENPMVSGIDKALAAADSAQSAHTSYLQSVADEVRLAWSVGPEALIEAPNEQTTLASMISEDLADVPGNVLHDVIRYIGKRAKVDAEAMAIIDRIANARADVMGLYWEVE